MHSIKFSGTVIVCELNTPELFNSWMVIRDPSLESHTVPQNTHRLPRLLPPSRARNQFWTGRTGYSLVQRPVRSSGSSDPLSGWLKNLKCRLCVPPPGNQAMQSIICSAVALSLLGAELPDLPSEASSPFLRHLTVLLSKTSFAFIHLGQPCCPCWLYVLGPPTSTDPFRDGLQTSERMRKG